MKRSDNRLSGRLARLASASLRLTESATAVEVRETGRMLEASTSDTGKVTRKIQVITPGWGSSGYYSAAVLEKAATDKVIPAGTHMYLNHASATEAHDRPERDVEKLAAVLTEDAIWDGAGLIAEAELLGKNGELIGSIAPYIGVSIDGSATDIRIGEAEGRTGRIIEGLAHVSSVDFVTHAGRGGAILESALPSVVNARAVEHGVTEATVNDSREQLQGLLRDTFGADETWIWVRDFDDDNVWYEHETSDSWATYQIAYERGEDGNVTALSGTPVEVRASTTYVPVARPDDTTTTESHKEGTVEINDNELAELREKAGRADQLAAQLAESGRKSAATELLNTKATEAKVSFTALEQVGILTMIEAKDDGTLDADAFTKLVEAEVEAKKTSITEAAGSGRPTGFGESADTTNKTTESGPRTKNAWGRGLTEKASA